LDSEFPAGRENPSSVGRKLHALSVFTTDVRNHSDINETCREVLGSNFPTRTMVQVVALARPELLLEINATAVIP